MRCTYCCTVSFIWFAPPETSSTAPPSYRAAGAFARKIPDGAPENLPPENLLHRDVRHGPRNSCSQPSCCRWLCPALRRRGCRHPSSIPSPRVQTHRRGRREIAHSVAVYLTRSCPGGPTKIVEPSQHRSFLSPVSSALQRAHGGRSSRTSGRWDRSRWSPGGSTSDRVGSSN